MSTDPEFQEKLTAALLSDRTSEAIAREFGIRSEGVRKRRRMMRRGITFIPKALRGLSSHDQTR